MLMEAYIANNAEIPSYQPLIGINDITDKGKVAVAMDKFEKQLEKKQDRKNLIKKNLFDCQKKIVNLTPNKRCRVVEQFERNERLSGLLKELSGWKCQICGFTFEKKDGGLYAETHHLEALAKGGYDSIENIIVVCPNHHKMLEYGNVSILETTPRRISLELNGERYIIERG